MKNIIKNVILSTVIFSIFNVSNLFAQGVGTIVNKVDPIWNKVSYEVSTNANGGIGVLEGENLYYVNSEGHKLSKIGALKFFTNSQLSEDVTRIGGFSGSYAGISFKDGSTWFFDRSGKNVSKLNAAINNYKNGFFASDDFGENLIGGKTSVEGDYPFFDENGELLEFTDENFNLLFKTARNNNQNPTYILLEVDDVFSNGLIWFKAKNTNDKIVYGYLNKNGKIIISPIFDKAGRFGSELAPVIYNGKLCYINKNGKIEINTNYIDFSDEYKGKVFLKDLDTGIRDSKELWSSIDKNGNASSGFISEDPVVFFGELAVVNVDGKYGYVDRRGSMVIEPQFDKAFGFANNTTYSALVCKDDLWFLIDSEGKKISKETWDFEDAITYDILPEVVMYKKDGLWGLGKIQYKK